LKALPFYKHKHPTPSHFEAQNQLSSHSLLRLSSPRPCPASRASVPLYFEAAPAETFNGKGYSALVCREQEKQNKTKQNARGKNTKIGFRTLKFFSSRVLFTLFIPEGSLLRSVH